MFRIFDGLPTEVREALRYCADNFDPAGPAFDLERFGAQATSFVITRIETISTYKHNLIMKDASVHWTDLPPPARKDSDVSQSKEGP